MHAWPGFCGQNELPWVDLPCSTGLTRRELRELSREGRELRRALSGRRRRKSDSRITRIAMSYPVIAVVGLNTAGADFDAVVNHTASAYPVAISGTALLGVIALMRRNLRGRDAERALEHQNKTHDEGPGAV